MPSLTLKTKGVRYTAADERVLKQREVDRYKAMKKYHLKELNAATLMLYQAQTELANLRDEHLTTNSTTN